MMRFGETQLMPQLAYKRSAVTCTDALTGS